MVNANNFRPRPHETIADAPLRRKLAAGQLQRRQAIDQLRLALKLINRSRPALGDLATRGIDSRLAAAADQLDSIIRQLQGE